MEVTSYIWALIFAVGAIQGGFLAGVLVYVGHPPKAASRLLAILVGCTALLMAEESIEAARLIAAFPHSREATMTIPLLIGPLFYGYALFITKRKYQMRWHDSLHALPFLLSTLYFTPYYFQKGADKLSGALPGLGGWSFEVDALIILKGAHLFAYLFLTVPVLRTYIADQRQAESPQHTYRHILWSKRLLYATIGGALGIYGLIGLASIGIPVMESDAFGSLFMAFLTYLFAFVALKYPASFVGVDAFKAVQQTLAQNATSPPKYQRSTLNTAAKQNHLNALLDYMETEQPYLNPKLGLQELADAVDLPPHTVSQVINELLAINLQAFINAYRVDEAKRKMAVPEHAHKTLLALAFESGFNSKTSFNRVFKNHTGLTPTQYRQTLASSTDSV